MNLSSTIIFATFRSFFYKNKSKSLKPIASGILTIALAFIPLVLVYHVSDGMIKGILNRYLETSSYHFKALTNTEKLLPSMLEKLKSVDGVTHVSLERNANALIVGKTQSSGLQVRGVEPNWYAQDSKTQEYLEIIRGEFDLSATNNLLLGDALAKQLELAIGDTIDLVSTRTFSNGRTVPRVNKFTLVGTFSSGYQILDELWVFMPYNTAKKLFSWEDSSSFLGIKVEHPYQDLEEYSALLSSELDSHWFLYNWELLNYEQKRNFDSTKTSLSFIMFLIIIIAISNIGSSITMLGLSKRNEIAVLKSMGATQRDLTLAYSGIALVMTFVANIIGISLGVILSIFINEILFGLEVMINFVSAPFRDIPLHLLNTQYYLETVPIEINWGFLGLLTLLSLVLTFAFAYFPAKKLASIHPLEVFRKS